MLNVLIVYISVVVKNKNKFLDSLLNVLMKLNISIQSEKRFQSHKLLFLSSLNSYQSGAHVSSLNSHPEVPSLPRLMWERPGRTLRAGRGSLSLTKASVPLRGLEPPGDQEE